MLAGCDQQPAMEESKSAEKTPAEVTPTEQERKLNAALDAMAKDVAAALNRQSVRTLIKKETGTLLANQHNVLFETIASKKVEGLAKDGTPMTFEQVLAQKRTTAMKAKSGQDVSLETALRNLNQDAETIPKFDIGVPAHHEKWDPKETTPLVAFHHRQEIDDTELERLKAYDAEGNVHWLDAFEKPDRPVVDVGINERTTADGKVLPAYQRDNQNKRIEIGDDPCTYNCGGGGDDGDGSTGGTRDWGDREFLKEMYLSKDEDADYGLPDFIGGWRENAPEVRLRVRSINKTGSDAGDSGLNEYTGSISGVEGDNSWYDAQAARSDGLFNWNKDVGNKTVWFFFDHDPGKNSDEYSIVTEGKTYVFSEKYAEDDDVLGWDTVNFEDDPTSITYFIEDGKFRLEE